MSEQSGRYQDSDELNLSDRRLQVLGKLDISVAEILAALDDEEAGRLLAARRGWTEQELRDRTETLRRQLSAEAMIRHYFNNHPPRR
jgi:DNA-binding transcriptional MerR regulator